MDKIKIAFYKGKGGKFDKLIRWWTKGAYSHTELKFPSGSAFSMATYPPNRGRWTNDISWNQDKWDFIEININDINKAHNCANELVGKNYDWKGIFLSQIFPFKLHNKKQWFCNEACLHIAQQAEPENSEISKMKPHHYNPNSLYKALKKLL